MDNAPFPVAVIGAGPVGLAAAAHLAVAGREFVVFERGASAAAAVREWAHVRIFSPWSWNLDKRAVDLLEATGWAAPDSDAFPTGGDLVERYLAPLAATPALAPRIRYGATVTSAARAGVDKLKTPGRTDRPFALRIETADGDEEDVFAGAVIDASGTWRTPNPLGASGVPAIGEAAARAAIRYGIPDVLGADRPRYGGRRTVVVGAGHSAFNALFDLVELAEEHPGTGVEWAIRRDSLENVFGRGESDWLVERGRLGARIGALVDAGKLTVHTGARIDRVESGTGPVRLFAGGRLVTAVDEVICATGFRPDLSMTSELRLSIDGSLESPEKLAPLIDPNLHSCGSVPPHGVEELAHPAEPGYFAVGMKSYGRAPTALMLTSYGQVESVVASLAGEPAKARSVA